MKKVSWLLVVLSLLLTVAGCHFGTESYEVRRSFEKNYSYGMELDIETSSGDIIIDNWNRDYIQIIAEITAYAHTRNRAMEVAEDTTIDFSYRDKKLKIRKENYHKGDLTADVSVAYRIKIPQTFSGHFDTSSGDIRVEEIVGDLRAETSSGDINLDEVIGDVQTDTSSGDVKAEQIIGDLIHISSSGDVDINYLRGRVDIEASSGDIKGTFALEDNISKINVSSGETEVNLAGSPSLEVVLTTSSGEINISNLDWTEIFEISEETVKGVIGGGDGKLEIDSSSGDIFLSN